MFIIRDPESAPSLNYLLRGRDPSGLEGRHVARHRARTPRVSALLAAAGDVRNVHGRLGAARLGFTLAPSSCACACALCLPNTWAHTPVLLPRDRPTIRLMQAARRQWEELRREDTGRERSAPSASCCGVVCMHAQKCIGYLFRRMVDTMVSHVLVRAFTARRIASAICSGEWSTPWSFSAGAFRRERKREGKRRWRLSTCEPRCCYGAHRRFRIPLLSPVLPSPQRLVCPEAGAKNGPKP
jgi:hypothetical protein